MSRHIEIFPGLDYAYRVVPDGPPSRVSVESYKPESAAGGEYITGRFHNGRAINGERIVPLRREGFVTTWDAHAARPGPGKATPGEAHYFMTGLIVGVIATTLVSLLITAILIGF